MNRVRVVHILEDLALGGLERVVQNLARLASPDYRVEVVGAVAGGRIADELAASGTPVRILGVRGYHPTDIRRAARALTEMAPDIVHTHGHFAGVLGRVAAWWSGVPAIIHHLHTLDGTLSGRHRGLERLLARATHRILCCSRAVQRHALDVLGLPSQLTRTIYNGVDPPPDVSREEAHRLLGGPPRPVIGCVGALAQHKGQEVLIRACALLPPEAWAGSLVLVGEGPQRPRLARIALEFGLPGRVLFLGERSDARRLMPAFDLAAVPSLQREGLGLSAIEAMDAGCPVVASRVGGLEEVVDHGRTGLLVPPGDPAALSSAVRDLLARPEHGRALGVLGRRRVETMFRSTTMTRGVETVYEEVLRERRAA